MRESANAKTLSEGTRRSTRVPRSLPVTVMGVDAFRAPFEEHVNTLEVSCHGCKYTSKYDVIQNEPVTLLFGNSTPDSLTHTIRGRVKWVRRPESASEHFQIAVELEAPGNVWGIEPAPEDWLSFPSSPADISPVPASSSAPAQAPAPLPSAQAKPSRPVANIEQGRPQLTSDRAAQPVAPVSSGMPQLLDQFGAHIQKIAAEAVTTALARETHRIQEEHRAQLKKEVEDTVRTSAAAHLDEWTRQRLTQINEELRGSATKLHGQWVKRLELDLRQVDEQISSRRTGMDQQTAALVTNTVEHAQRVLEASEREWRARFIARLQEQLAPLLDHVRRSMVELVTCRNEVQELLKILRARLEDTVQESTLRSAEKLQEIGERLEIQLDHTIRVKLAKSLEEVESKRNETTRALLSDLENLAAAQGKKVESSLRAALEPALRQVSDALQAKAAETSRRFAAEINDYSRSLLESIGQSVAELPDKLLHRPPTK